MRKKTKVILWFSAIPIILVVGMAWLLWGGVSNPANRKTIGEIRTPIGFERISVEPDSFGAFLREFPLQKRGSHMEYYNGRMAYGQYFGYAVLDLPMISNAEQCADAVMRMRSEYLFSKERFSDIHFQTFQDGTMRYKGSRDKNNLHDFLKRVYRSSNTSTLRKELKQKSWKDLSPGDVLVYQADARHSVGHAVLIVDVAMNPKTGKKAIMIAQSSMPALTMHIVRDFLHPLNSPWVIIDDSDDNIFISGIQFDKNDLRCW